VSETIDAIVIGAGFAGLGTGAALKARGVSRFAIVEQGGSVGHFWTQTYDRIHLHSAFHDLPDDGGLRRDYGMFLTRDELLDYFRRYAERHGLAPHLRFGTRVTRVARIRAGAADGAEWEIVTSGGALRTRQLAVATAVNRVPVVPDLPGRSRFRGHVLHSSEYRNAAPFAGHRVLVVGSGNSAAEICLDLVGGGAREVAMWVRGPRHFLPLSRVAWLFRLIRLLGQFTPAKIAEIHAVSADTPEFLRIVEQRDKLMARLSVDLSRYGIRRPSEGPTAETFLRGRIPTFDVGAIAKIRSGAIRVIDGNARPIAGFEEAGVRLGETAERFDDVILATGFDPGLGEFIADAELLGPVRWHPLLPLTDGRCRSRVHPSIFFPGFDVTPLGGISLGYWGREVGTRMAEALFARSSRAASGQMAASAATDATSSCQPSAS
jgi:cation diffusion facilitator CzcD-associated flavoprotein CzcO